MLFFPYNGLHPVHKNKSIYCNCEFQKHNNIFFSLSLIIVGLGLNIECMHLKALITWIVCCIAYTKGLIRRRWVSIMGETVFYWWNEGSRSGRIISSSCFYYVRIGNNVCNVNKRMNKCCMSHVFSPKRVQKIGRVEMLLCSMVSSEGQEFKQ